MMMYIKVANFSGFDQVAICPGGDMFHISPGPSIKSSRSLLSRFTSNPKRDLSLWGANENQVPKNFFQGNFYIVDRSENSHVPVHAEGTFSFLPYFPGHFYYLFRGNGGKLKEFSYFHSSEEIRRLLLQHLQTPLVSFNALNVNVSQEFVPHLTLSDSGLSFEFEDPGVTAHDISHKETASQLSMELSKEEPEDLSLLCNSLLEELMLDVVSRGERFS